MPPLPTETVVAVIGAGTMGRGIAQVAARAGHPVLLFDTHSGAADAAVAMVADNLGPSGEGIGAAGPVRAATTLADLAAAGLVIEAVAEDLDVKRGVLAALEAAVGPEAVLATNTSALSVTAMARGLERPGRVVGMHFLNPAPAMALVEIVSGLDTDPAVAAVAFDTASAWGKVPVHVAASPGFIVNRVARPFYGEALRLLEDRAADPATIDAVMTGCGGFPIGPCALMDRIGHDVSLAATTAVWEAFYRDPRYRPSRIQAALVEAGRLGRKSGRGFFDYGADTVPPAPRTAPLGPRPTAVVVEGGQGPAERLVGALVSAGIPFTREDGEGQIAIDGAVLALTDGRTATERGVVVFDLAPDYRAAGRIALAVPDGSDPAVVAAAAGLFQALGKTVSVVDDMPGLIVMRTVCMLANEALDAVHQGIATAEAVDTALTRGLNHPRGPLAWVEALGPARMLRVLNNLARFHGDGRHRASPRLHRRALAKGGYRA